MIKRLINKIKNAIRKYLFMRAMKKNLKLAKNLAGKVEELARKEEVRKAVLDIVNKYKNKLK